ncbi:GIY-YIG nuclease family protein [Rhodococcus sp. NPDC078407]|uniref:GIY-YIG nuclease family protein n=1 Tax=unclassified Rhodococcus (in: high G+C Gram-positive bacteria) TaxID=192944 RepID=UPI002ADB7DA4|nr:GIY-YIG nuclease family protein [Rhodococcus sp. (in: high G+C Gram-positive bacteria)]
MARAQTIQIYLPGGNPAGIRVASLTTRTVRVFDVPRTLLTEFTKLSVSRQVGVYYLFGDNDDDRTAYIGQTGNVSTRLGQHSSKDWERAMVAVSLTNEWTSTHVAYLEWLSIQAARRADRYTLTNGNDASNPFTPDPLEADCHEFLDTISILLTTLGAPILDSIQPASSGSRRTDEDTTELLYFSESDCAATGYLTTEGLVVKSGSRGRPDFRGAATERLKATRESLISSGRAALTDEAFVFQVDELFDSPSAAGAVLVGGSNNGRISWKNAAGEDLNMLEARDLARVQKGRDGDSGTTSGSIDTDVESST